MKALKKEAFTFVVDNEAEAYQIVEDYKANQLTDGYQLGASKVNYKSKKKNGEIVAELWTVVVEKVYEVDM